MLSLPPNLAQQVTIALVEDIGSGDVTAELVPADQRVTGKVISREPASSAAAPGSPKSSVSRIHRSI